jgi:prepilin-type N-terminal cleavage/methylation domain-containing protein
LKSKDLKKIMKSFKKGFTLIELLVVVAIIGILASVVLASLNSARTKGEDAAIKANLSNIRAQAELFYDSTTGGDGTYSDVCDDPNVSAAVTAAGGHCDDGDGSAWAAAADLKGTSGASWCVDSTGVSEQNTVSAATEVADQVCDGD